MRIKVILNQADDGGLGITFIGQVFEAVGILQLGATGGHLHLSPGSQGLTKHEEIAGAMAFVFIIVALGFTWLHRQGRARFANELLRAFVKADDWS